MKSIEEAAELTGTSCETIRHYQSLYLLPPSHQEEPRQRFSETDIQMIRIITQLKEVGFRIEELAALTSQDKSDQPFTLHLACSLIDLRREQIRQEIDELIACERGLLNLKETLKKHCG